MHVLIGRLAARGELFSAGPRNARRHFASRAAADAYVLSFTPSRLTANAGVAAGKRGLGQLFAPPRLGRNPQLDPSLPAVVPAHVRETECPGYPGDTRYAVSTAPRVIDASECREWAREATRGRWSDR